MIKIATVAPPAPYGRSSIAAKTNSIMAPITTGIAYSLSLRLASAN